LHTPEAGDAELTVLVRRLTTEFYSHSHLITRTEAAALGLPVEEPPPGVEDRLLTYYNELTTDLELLEKFDPGAMLEQRREQPDPLRVVLERAYIETPTTCDSFVTRGVISQQPATLEVTSERWETLA
jgi:hypothetical protein